MMRIKEHLKSRYVDLDLHRVYIDEYEGVATFPIFNESYQMVGYQQYRPTANKKKRNHPKEGRYYTYTLKNNRGYWGLESKYLSKTLFLTEGIFDAARLTYLGYSAIAALSNDPKHISNELMFFRMKRKVVVICDHGKAGKKLAKYGHEYHTMPEEYDLGAASDDYVKGLIDYYGK